MNSENTSGNMANFICELRKSKNMTQKQLAEKLHVTDKAVSKWERGQSYPEITTLSPLADILGVTVNELLNGQRDGDPDPERDIVVQNTLQYAQKAVKTKNRSAKRVIEAVILFMFITAIFVCVICDLAVSKGLTWSLYPISSIVYTWLIIMPLFHFEKKSVKNSLISLSVFTIPFLFCIERITGVRWLLPLGIPNAAVFIIYLWIIYFLFTTKKLSKWYLSAISLILMIPVDVLVNVIVARATNEPIIDFWDIFSYAIVSVISFLLLCIGYFSRRKSD